MTGSDRLRGSPRRGLTTATVAFFAGLTSIVFYGAAGPTFMEALGLTGAHTGLLLSSPHVSKAVLRIPFGAWVDEVGGRLPFLVLLCLTTIGLAGVVALLWTHYPDGFDRSLYWWLVLCGLVGGAGGATFSVGIPQTAYWYPVDRQGWALGVFAGAGNIGPGLVNYLLPLVIGAWGLTAGYVGWLSFLVLVTLYYAVAAVDPFYFQLRRRGLGEDRAREVARSEGQEVFPSGGTWSSLRDSASNGRTWILVFLYTVSFGGGFTALTAWFPTYWKQFHFHETGTLWMAGLLAGIFTVYGSLIRIPGGSLSDRFGGEVVAIGSFLVMVAGSGMLAVSSSLVPAVTGMIVLGTGMGVANAAVFEMVPVYVPDAVGGASGWIGGLGGAGTLVILPVLGTFVDVYGRAGYARGFAVLVVLSAVCAAISYGLKRMVPVGADMRAADPPAGRRPGGRATH